MANNSFTYILSLEADIDFEEIFDYTKNQFGEHQAETYATGLAEMFEALCNNPQLGRERNDILSGLRSISYQSHTIFYRIINNSILINRILHSSRDVSRFL